MDPLREEAVADLEHTLDTVRLVRAQLRTMETAYRRAIRNIGQGLPIVDVLESMTAAAVRVNLNHVLDELEHARHRARLAMIAAGLHEGMSIGEMGRVLGFSRQLASRYAKEARQE